MRFALTAVAATSLLVLAALPGFAGPYGSVVSIETDKGCKVHVFLQDSAPAQVPKMPFKGTCKRGKPINGKGQLIMPAIAMNGTWVNGVLNGPATLRPVEDGGKLGPAQKAEFAMGCITSLDGHKGEMPGCKDEMAPFAKKAP